MHYSFAMLAFWNNVKDELEYKLMSQKELAKATEISYNTLQSWMTKDRLPDASDSVRIAKVLGVSVEYLVTGVDNSKKRENAELDELIRDIRHLSSDDLSLARSVVHRLSVPAG